MLLCLCYSRHLANGYILSIGIDRLLYYLERCFFVFLTPDKFVLCREESPFEQGDKMRDAWKLDDR